MTQEYAISKRDLAIYPKELLDKEVELVAKLEAEKKNPNLRVKLALIAESFTIFAQRETIENAIKVKALGGLMKARMDNKRLG